MLEVSYVYPAKFDSAVDGRIVQLIIDLGFDMWIHQRFRIEGIFVPSLLAHPVELRNQAQQARQFIETKLSKAEEIRVISTRREHDIFFGEIFYRMKPRGKWHNLGLKMIKSCVAEMEEERQKEDASQ